MIVDRLRSHWRWYRRWVINGERSRFDACSAIPAAALQILKEYRDEYSSFHALHDTDERLIVDALIIWGDAIIESRDFEYWGDATARSISLGRPTFYDDQTAWQAWLRALTRVLPRLWD